MSQTLSPPKRGFLNMPKLPVSGLFARLLAFLLDLIVIIAGIHLIAKGIPGFFWWLGPASGYATGTYAFLYFVLLNGPLGRGQTVGKRLMGIVVTDLDGDPPTFRHAAIRTSILLPAFIMIPVVEAFLGPTQSVMGHYLKSLLTYIPLLAMAVTTLLIVPFNPFKQGAHDYLGRTLVQPKPRGRKGPLPSFDELAESLGHEWPKFHRQPQISGAVTFAMILSVIGYMAHPSQHRPASRAYLDARFQATNLPGYQRASIEDPLPLALHEAAKAQDDEQYRAALEQLNAATTGTMTLVVEVSRPGRWDAELVESPTRTEAFLDYYHRSILPLYLDDLRGALPGGREETMEGRRRFARRLAESELTLQLLYINRVSLSPHILTLREDAGSYSKSFPPMERQE